MPIKGHEGSYEVSDLGRVRTIERRVANGVGVRRVSARLRRLYVGPGKVSVNLSRRNKPETRSVPRLVLEAFIGPCPPGHEACHNDGNLTNNRLDNLRWDSHIENIADKFRHGTDHNINKTHCKRGHLLVEPNLKPAQLAKGGRSCLACSREYALARSQRRAFDPARADDRYRELGL